MNPSTTPAAFKIGLDPQQTLDILAAAYRVEVERRARRFILDTPTAAALEKLARYIVDPGSRFGVLMRGPVGNGKTTLMRALQRAIAYLDANRHFTGLYTGTDPYQRVALDVYKSREICEASRRPKEFDDLIRTPLLGIDDLGAEPADIFDYNNLRTPMTDLFDYRYDRRLFTVVTTNLAGRAAGDRLSIRAKYGTRIADRFNEMFCVITLANQSYRTDEP